MGRFTTSLTVSEHTTLSIHLLVATFRNVLLIRSYCIRINTVWSAALPLPLSAPFSYRERQYEQVGHANYLVQFHSSV